MTLGVAGFDFQRAAPLPAQAFNLCELCSAPAHVLCPSDDAFLCRRCDCLVHSANFLVARHHRTFLCRSCASPTASGARGESLPAASLLCNCCSLASQADVSCGSRSEDTTCSDLTSDCDSERQPSAYLASTGPVSRRCESSHFSVNSVDAFEWVSQEELLSDSEAVVDEEELSSAGVGPLPCCSREESDGKGLSHVKHHQSYCFDHSNG